MTDVPLFRDSERDKYLRVWADRSYGTQTDGLPAVSSAFRGMGCQPGETLIDWGCGTGRAAKNFRDMGLRVTGFDIAHNCLAEGVDVPLVVGCIWEPPRDLAADYGFCTDVLEHVPPDYLDQALDTLYWRAEKATFIQIDTVLDISGPAMDPPEVLHLSVYDRWWWEDELAARWRAVIGSKGLYTRWRFLCLR